MAKGSTPSNVGKGSMDAAQNMFLGSNGARRAVFRQLSSALSTGGGKGFKSGFAREAVTRSNEANTASLRNASASLPANMDPSIRGRVLNRIAQTNKQVTAGIGPGFANALIAQGPKAIPRPCTRSSTRASPWRRRTASARTRRRPIGPASCRNYRSRASVIQA